MIDIFITSYLRPEYTKNTIKYLKERTKYPYRLILIDNGGNEVFKDEVDYYVGLSKNIGIHGAWNIALALAESEYFITSDNDIYVPDLEPDWLTRLVKFMEYRPEYGAISLHPHAFIGAKGEDPNDPADVKERNMCGAVMRIMRTEAVRKAGGWEHIISNRNHEEKTICSRLQANGYKVGITTRIRAYHQFGKNWGYPENMHPHEHGHRIPGDEIWPPPENLDQMDSFDNKTWIAKL